MKHFKNDFQSLTQPGRSECGVQLARGFPPRSKWTYGEVFHPAVVPQPPFIKCFGFLLNTSLHKAILTQLNVIYHIVLLPIIQLPSCHMTEKKIFFISRGSFNPVRDRTKSLGCLGESTAVQGILKFFWKGFQNL